MDALNSVAGAIFGGIIPVTSHIAAVAVSVRAIKTIAEICLAKQGVPSDVQKVNTFLRETPYIRNVVTISLVRDLLGMAAVVTLACLSILTPVMAIGIGAALLVSLILSAVAIGQSVSVINLGQLWKGQFI